MMGFNRMYLKQILSALVGLELDIVVFKLSKLIHFVGIVAVT